MDTRLSYSQIQCAKDCLRKHWFSYVIGLRPKAAPLAWQIGSWIHAGIEALAALMTRDEIGLALDAATEPLDAELDATSDADVRLVIGYQRAVVRAMLRGYAWRWAAMDRDMTINAVEQPFAMLIINPDSGRASTKWTLCGKIDALATMAGNQSVWERKTVSEDISPESDYWARLRIDSQISLYFLAAQHIGYSPSSIWYDVLRKPLMRPANIPQLDADGLKIAVDAYGIRVLLANGKPRQSADKEKGIALLTVPETPDTYEDRLVADIGERPDHYFARREFARVEDDVLEAQFELWQSMQLINDCVNYGRWPRNTRSCLNRGKCSYFGICTCGGYRDGDPVPDGFEIVSNTHQEVETENETGGSQ